VFCTAVAIITQVDSQRGVDIIEIIDANGEGLPGQRFPKYYLPLISSVKCNNPVVGYTLGSLALIRRMSVGGANQTVCNVRIKPPAQE
jgi:hypothetical protein